MPNFSGKQMIALLEGIGFEQVRTRGSHVSMSNGTLKTVVPLHKELKDGTVSGILRQTGLSKEDFMRLKGQ